MASKQRTNIGLPVNHPTHDVERHARIILLNTFMEKGHLVSSIGSDLGETDYGEDLLVELCHPENRAVLPYRFFIQSKGVSKVTRIRDEHIAFAMETKHINKWKKDKIPVLFTIWDKDSNNTYWLLIQDYLECFDEKSKIKFNKKLKRQDHIDIHIPLSNILNDENIEK